MTQVSGRAQGRLERTDNDGKLSSGRDWKHEHLDIICEEGLACWLCSMLGTWCLK